MASKLLPHNADGVKLCLTHLNDLQAKSVGYIKNAIHFFNKGLTPWEGSVITYNPTNGFFHYINADDVKVITYWKNYTPQRECFIREHTFFYSNIEPYLIIVSDSRWVRDNLREPEEAMANKYYKYLQDHITVERNEWKNILAGGSKNIHVLFD
jgi:hypothetical protein